MSTASVTSRRSPRCSAALDGADVGDDACEHAVFACHTSAPHALVDPLEPVGSSKRALDRVEPSQRPCALRPRSAAGRSSLRRLRRCRPDQDWRAIEAAADRPYPRQGKRPPASRRLRSADDRRASSSYIGRSRNSEPSFGRRRLLNRQAAGGEHDPQGRASAHRAGGMSAAQPCCVRRE